MEEQHPRKREHKKSKKGSSGSSVASVATSRSKPDVGSEAAMKEQQRRRQARLERQQRKVRQQMAELGLDEHGNPLDNYSLLKYPVRECKFTLPFLGTEPIALNPIVTLMGVLFIWGIVVWSTLDPHGSKETLIEGRTHITLTYIWLLQGSKALLFFFMIYIVYKYGHIHLGRNKNEPPEFNLRSWFAMIFSSGTGPALLFYSASEPLFHQVGNYYAQAGYRSQDEIDLFAINVTVSNWSISTWLVFTVVAVCTALAVHCFGLPLTFRSCFYPIFGAYTWGWMGDCIDGLAIIIMIMSVCTMMCMSSIQIVTGLKYMGWVDPDSTADEITMMQKAAVWFVTFVSTASVISGLPFGIQYMSLLATSLGFLLLFLLFAMDDTKYLLNLQIQEVGYYLQNSIFQLNFWTDAMGQLRAGEGRAIDGKAANQDWMSSWIVFYQAWGVALSTVFGVFVARISKGRKLWELVMACFLAPSLALLIWFCIWGGIGLRQSRQGKELAALGETYFDNSGHFLKDGSDLCYDVPQHDVVVNETTIFTNYLPGVTPVCQFGDANAGTFIFDIMYSFNYPDCFGGKGLGPTLTFIYLLCCAIYYVAISDSTSLIVDNIASNGRKNNHWARRMFWASSVGALTTTILSSGSADALKAVEAAVIVGSLPAAFLLCGMFQSILLLCRAADKAERESRRRRRHSNDDDETAAVDNEGVDYEFPTQPEFSMPVYGGVLNVLEYIMSLGKVNAARVELGMHCPSREQVVEFVKGLLIPYMSLHQVLQVTFPQNPRTNKLTVAFYGVCYVVWTALWIASFIYPGLMGLTATAFAVTGLTLGIVRAGFRHQYNIRSNYFADLLVGLFLWPQVLSQMRLYDDNVFASLRVLPLLKEKRSKRQSSRYSDNDDDDDDNTTHHRNNSDVADETGTGGDNTTTGRDYTNTGYGDETNTNGDDGDDDTCGDGGDYTERGGSDGHEDTARFMRSPRKLKKVEEEEECNA